MERQRLLDFYQSMNNLPDSETKLADAIVNYLGSAKNISPKMLECLNSLHSEMSSSSSINNMAILFTNEFRGKLADVSIAISSYFAEEESLSRPLLLLANLRIACQMRDLDNASELISAIEEHLKTEAAGSNKMPTLQALAVLESIIEDPSQDRSIYAEIFESLGAFGESSFFDEDSVPTLTGEEEYINPFLRRETAAQSVLEQRILIVDDEKMIAATVGFILSDLDLPIDLVGDGAAALDRLNERPYSLVISDIEMPNFDGFSLIGAMRNDFQFSDVPLIFMSNKEDYRELALELGATDFFLKGSISGPELVEKISAVLEDAPYVPQQEEAES